MGLAMDRQTFDRLVLEHLPSAQRFAIRLTGDTNAADDLMQDALLKAHKHWDTFKGESRFTTWLFRIVINCFRDSAPRHAPSEPLGDSYEVQDPHAAPPDQSLQYRELQERVACEVSR